jgi:general secretion pathway protein G
VFGASTLNGKVLSKKSIFLKGQTMKSKSGFTLVEILIVVVILGILAAIVIPQFTEASTEAKTSSLCTDLQTVRSQIELYKIQHNDALPGAVTGVDFESAMTKYTDQTGALATTQEPGDGVYGPYLQKIPSNPFITDSDTADSDAVDEGTDSPGGGTTGWYFNTTTGAFNANDSAHTSL